MEPTHGPWTSIGEYIYSSGSNFPVAEAKAYPRSENARFIAASPDMLRVLRYAFLECVECGGNIEYPCTRFPCPEIRAVIAQALGEKGS